VYLLFTAQELKNIFADSAVAILPVSVRLIEKPVNREHHCQLSAQETPNSKRTQRKSKHARNRNVKNKYTVRITIL